MPYSAAKPSRSSYRKGLLAGHWCSWSWDLPTASFCFGTRQWLRLPCLRCLVWPRPPSSFSTTQKTRIASHFVCMRSVRFFSIEMRIFDHCYLCDKVMVALCSYSANLWAFVEWLDLKLSCVLGIVCSPEGMYHSHFSMSAMQILGSYENLDFLLGQMALVIPTVVSMFLMSVLEVQITLWCWQYDSIIK